jgi:Phage protein (N4 Gp49/phage Sf6 gene 66) family
MSEQQIEQEIQAKGLNAPRVTPAQIDAAIASEAYQVFEGSCLTVCCLTLQNGFTVTGESACASPANFNAELGRKIAREKARDKIWALEGYLLRQRLQDGSVTGSMTVNEARENLGLPPVPSIFETAVAARAAGPEEKY